MDKIIIENNPTPQDIYKIKKYVFFSRYFKSKTRIIIYILILIFIALNVFRLGNINLFNILLVLFLFIMFVILSFLINLLQLVFFRITANKHIDSIKQHRGSTTEISKEGYTFEYRNQEILVPWTDFTEFKETKSDYIGVFDKINIFIISKDSFANEEELLFAEECMSQIPSYKKRK